MSKISVKNSCIIINNYEFGDCTKIENFFRLYDKERHCFYYKGLYYDKENKKLYLPRGLDIWYLENLFNEKATVYRNKYNKFDKYDDIYIKYLPRDDVQKKTLRFMLGKGEYNSNAAKSQLSVNLNTGKGKTYVSIATMAYLGMKSIIITYSKEWLKQWKDRILEYTNIKPKEIYNIDGSIAIHRLLRKSTEEIKSIKIFLVTHATIKSYGDKNGWENVRELFEYLRIGLTFYDEAHLNFDNMCMIDFFNNSFRTYYITATAARSSEDENRIYQLCFKNVPSIELFNKDEDPHTSYTAIIYNSKPSPMIISDCKNKYGLDRNKYINYIVTQDIFYKVFTIIMQLILKATSNGGKCLIFIGTNQAISIVYEWMINNYPELSNNIGIFTSLYSDAEKKLALEKRIILSTTKSAGAAVDISGLKMTVVLAEPFKSQIIARQTLGRTRDDNTMYIELVDKGFIQCYKYFLQKRKIFNVYATDTKMIKLSNDDIENTYNDIYNKRHSSLIRPFEYSDNPPLIRPFIYVDE